MTVPENIQDKSSHGGPRKGAGRKAGSATKKTREIAERAMADGVTPLEYMLQIMRAEPSADLEPKDLLSAQLMRFEAAKAAAPYIHPRLAAIEHTGKDGNALRIEIVNYAAEPQEQS